MNEDDVKKWCKITEDFILSLFNEEAKNKNLLAYMDDYKSKLPEDMTFSIRNNQAATIYYKTCCGPQCAPSEFSLKIVEMDSARSIYYVSYGKGWWDFPNCEGDLIEGGKSLIMEKNPKTGKYYISARFEDSNFYRDFVNTGKLGEMVGIKGKGKPYGDAGVLETEYDPITSINGEIRFNTELNNCKPGGPSCHEMYLYWIYDMNKKLRCLYFLDRYQLVNDPATGKLKPSGKRVDLAP
jgi:hypothetical protein